MCLRGVGWQVVGLDLSDNSRVRRAASRLQLSQLIGVVLSGNSVVSTGRSQSVEQLGTS